MVFVRTLFLYRAAPTKTDIPCSKRKYVVYHLCVRSVPPFPPSAQCPRPSFADTYIFFPPFFCLLFAVQGALRASPAATPPLNMHATIIFNGVWTFAVATLVFFLEGKQTRREQDEKMFEEREAIGTQSIQMVRPSSQELEEKR
jgi:hypothetical protein